MKIFTTGDIHGQDSWKYLEDIYDLHSSEEIKTPKFDKYIFLGDYTDSFNVPNNVIYSNFIDIINLKKKYPDHVVLLLGNHELHYLFDFKKYRCSGFRPEMEVDLKELLKSNIDLFQASYRVNKVIWSHAGITNWWYRTKYEKVLDLPEYSSIGFTDDISLNLNLMLQHEIEELFIVGNSRGGYNRTGGPFWADKSELMHDPLPEYTQVVGHSPIKSVTVHILAQNSLIFCDCLHFKDEGFEIEV